MVGMTEPVVPDPSASDPAASEPAVADRMRTAAAAWLAALTDDQRRLATAPFDVADARDWTYLPGPRPGLPLSDMTDGQRVLAMSLLGLGLSPAGAATAGNVMQLEATLRELDRAAGGNWEVRHPLYFWFRVLGDPAGDQPWGWRVNGHHVAVHATLVGSQISCTPQFFGANPARVPSGEQAGFRALAAEEDSGRALFRALDEHQQQQALTAELAPWDLLTRHDPVVDLGRVARGLSWGDMTTGQRGQLESLVRLYLDRVTPAVGRRLWTDITEAGLANVSFAWAGPAEPGQGHYYAVLGQEFVLEYDCTQDGANHIHTVWRDVAHDWASDLLAQHYSDVAHP
jgi:hypothetical protein